MENDEWLIPNGGRQIVTRGKQMINKRRRKKFNGRLEEKEKEKKKEKRNKKKNSMEKKEKKNNCQIQEKIRTLLTIKSLKSKTLKRLFSCF